MDEAKWAKASGDEILSDINEFKTSLKLFTGGNKIANSYTAPVVWDTHEGAYGYVFKGATASAGTHSGNYGYQYPVVTSGSSWSWSTTISDVSPELLKIAFGDTTPKKEYIPGVNCLF